MFDYQYRPYAPFADDGQPCFFRRRYGGNPEPPMVKGGVVYFDLAPEKPIWIYGYSFLSEYDREQQRHVWQLRRAFFADCYSVMCPTGEPGFVPLDDVEEISKEEFEAAATRSWE